MAAKNEIAALLMGHLCSCAEHGYTQSDRWGDGTAESVEVGGSNFALSGGDRDCASSVISCYESVGVSCGGATYTGDMRERMIATGNFSWMGTEVAPIIGDIYLNEHHHAAMCVSVNPTVLAQFTSSEKGTAYGEKGDQTGKESMTCGFYDYPWDGLLRYTGSRERPNEEASAGRGASVRYRVRTAESGWLPELTDWEDSGPLGDDYAGNPGEKITYIAIDMPGWYRAKSESSGWLPPVFRYDVGDLANGCAGDGSPITAVRCYYETADPESTGWLAIEYQASRLGGGWDPPFRDLSPDDDENHPSNEDSPIDRFRARIVPS